MTPKIWNPAISKGVGYLLSPQIWSPVPPLRSQFFNLSAEFASPRNPCCMGESAWLWGLHRQTWLKFYLHLVRCVNSGMLQNFCELQFLYEYNGVIALPTSESRYGGWACSCLHEIVPQSRHSINAHSFFGATFFPHRSVWFVDGLHQNILRSLLEIYGHPTPQNHWTRNPSRSWEFVINKLPRWLQSK